MRSAERSQLWPTAEDEQGLAVVASVQADGSFAGGAGPLVDQTVSTSYQRIAELWQAPVDAYWIRAWVEVDGSNGADPIIWRIDNAALSVTP
jgi:hypothetical protein